MPAVMKARLGQRQYYRKKGVEWRSAQGGGDFERPFTDAFKSVLQWLHHERQRIKHRGDDQAPEGKGQGAEAERLR
jgi:hypothetical protein